jgi:AcrR family transcriptional regulator
VTSEGTAPLAGRRLPRGGAALPPDVVRDVQRRRLLGAIGAAVGENGYAATTIADIVARAGVSRSVFYECFSDKEACFLASYAAEAEQHFAQVAAALGDGEWIARLRDGIRAYVAGLEDRPAFARTFLVEVIAAGPRARAHRVVVHDRYATLLKTWYETERAQRGLPVLPDEVFHAAVVATNELAVQRLEGAAPKAAHDLAALVLYSLLALFGLPEEARHALTSPAPG